MMLLQYTLCNLKDYISVFDDEFPFYLENWITIEFHQGFNFNISFHPYLINTCLQFEQFMWEKEGNICLQKLFDFSFFLRPKVFALKR